MATQYSVLAWRIPWAEELGGLHAVHGVAKSWTRRGTLAHTQAHGPKSPPSLPFTVESLDLGSRGAVHTAQLLAV